MGGNHDGFSTPRNSCPGFQGALGEVDLLPATLAEMILVKLIGENFRFLAAIGAIADKRLQVPHLFKSRAMLGRCHKLLLKLMAVRLWFRDIPFRGEYPPVIKKRLPLVFKGYNTFFCIRSDTSLSSFRIASAWSGVRLPMPQEGVMRLCRRIVC
jgi:hypothetical protein